MWIKVAVNELYEVSDDGRVRRLETAREMALTPRRNGYVSVSLADGFEKKRHYVHRLVAAAFIGQIDDGLQINHKNFERHDNRVENLEIVTCAENAAHAKRAGRMHDGSHIPRGDKCRISKLRQAQVDQIRSRFEAGALKAHLAREFSVSKNQVANIINRTSWR